jgi:SAM-dependent methyltransferase
MAQPRPYYAPGALSAVFYDVVTGADRQLAGDIEVYAGLAPPGGSVLELGAGSGRITFALAERGFRVVGLDIAHAMLDQAEARRDMAPPEVAGRVELKLRDMTDFDLKRTFDAVICPYFSLAHVPAGAAWRNTFTRTAKHLAAGGLAAFHLPVKAMMALPWDQPDRAVLVAPLPGGGRLELYVRERRYRDAIGRLDQLIAYVERSAAGAVVRSSEERLTYWLADPVPLAAAAGLSLDRDPVPLGGAGHIWVFRKA